MSAIANKIYEARLRIVAWADHGQVEIQHVVRELLELEHYVRGEAKKLDDLLADGVNSGAPIEPTPEYWAGKKERLKAASDPKPAPLPHEWVPLNAFSAQCRCCAVVRSNEAIRLAKYSDPCPARNEPPAQKAEALPINVAAVYWLSDAICRSAAYLPATVQKAIYSLIEHILAEVDKRIAHEPMSADLYLHVEGIARRIAREELSKARLESRAGERWGSPRIVPGKEGE